MQSQPEPAHDKACPFNISQSPNMCECGESERLFHEARRALMDANMIWEDERRTEQKKHGIRGKKRT
jgi:ribosomal protein S9